MHIQDCYGHEIKVGSDVIYGEASQAVVTAISEPDIHSHDDDYGREIVDGLMVEITIGFEGGGTERCNASMLPLSIPPEHATDDDFIFMEPGDLEVISNA